MRWLIPPLLFLVLLTAQHAAAFHVAVLDAVPSLVTILVVQLALFLPRVEGAVWCWAMGLGVDFHDGGIVGVIAFTYALVALGINYFRRALFAEHLLTRLALVAAADALQRVAFAISEIIRGQSGGFLLLLRAQALGVIYTTLVAAALLPLLSLIIQKSYGSPRRA